MRRNDALLFRIIPERATATAKFTMSDVKVKINLPRVSGQASFAHLQLLNSVTDANDMLKIKILAIPLEDTDGFSNKLDMLLTWSITQHQYGDHRPYAVATLLLRWVDHSEDRAQRRGLSPPDEILQDRLFDWLDTSKVVTNTSNLAALTMMFGELISRGLFSYSKYIQRLIARGESGLLVTQVPEALSRVRKAAHVSLLGATVKTSCHFKVASSH